MRAMEEEKNYGKKRGSFTTMAILRTTVAALAVACISTGCAIVHRPYVSPAPSAVTAQLRIVDDQNRVLMPPRTMISTFDDPQSCTNRFWLQSGGPQPGMVTAASATIPAGKPFAVAIHHLERGKVCVPVLQFTPMATRHYVARLHVNTESCVVRLASTATDERKDERPEPYQSMKFSNGLSEESSFCRPK